MAPSSHGSHQLASRRMSVKVLLGATKVSMTRSACDSGLVSSGAAAAELMVLLLVGRIPETTAARQALSKLAARL